MGEEKGNVLYIAYDESNNERFPEINVCAFSKLAEDVYSKGKTHLLSKKRKLRRDFAEKLIQRDYTFLVLKQNEKEQIGGSRLLGVILTSLVNNKITPNDNYLRFFIDGEWQKEKINCAKDLISSYHKIDRERIIFEFGADFDRIFPLVNLADEIAYYLYRRPSLEDLSKNVHLKHLIEELSI